MRYAIHTYTSSRRAFFQNFLSKYSMDARHSKDHKQFVFQMVTIVRRNQLFLTKLCLLVGDLIEADASIAVNVCGKSVFNHPTDWE